VGVFDTVKAVRDGDLYDIDMNTRTFHLRQALALHEVRMHMDPEVIFPINKGKADTLPPDHSMVQAWFAGSHIDLGGSAAKAGLSLFPLQWMLAESRSKGLCLEFAGQYDGRAVVDNPLHLVFPQSNGQGKDIRPWQSTSANGIVSQMHDIRHVYEGTTFDHRYDLQINNTHSSLWPKKLRKPFDDVENINGFCSFAPQGTIIHPSVYLLLDTKPAMALETQKLKFLGPIESTRELMLGVRDGIVHRGFWGDNEIISQVKMPPIRILVCGNVGVGKSTLINKVFGVKEGEEVTTISHRDRGLHDVREEITYPDRPDLILHDSRGFEAASESEFEAFDSFLADKSGSATLEQRLHMIWFCLPLSESRPKQTSTERVFNAIRKRIWDVPVVVVATKKDEFADQHSARYRREVKQQGRRPSDEEIDQYAEDKILERTRLIAAEMNEMAGGCCDACVAVAFDDDASVKQLTETTAQSFSDEKIRLLYIRAQTSSVELKIASAMNEVMQTYKNIISTATGAAFAPAAVSTNRYASAIAVCTKILNTFGLPTVSADTAMMIVRAHVWEDLGNHVTLLMAEIAQGAAWGATVITGGMPFFLVAGVINLPIAITATSRLFLMLSADLILILARSFKDARDRQVGQPREQELLAAAKDYRKHARAVHRAIGKLVPRRNMFKSYMRATVGRGFREVVEDFSARMAQDSLAEEHFKKYAVEYNATKQEEDDAETLFTLEEVQEMKELRASVSELTIDSSVGS
jgi:GTPase SAR1 family protein